MAWLAVHDKRRRTRRLLEFLPAIARVADARNFVKKAVNWALRQVGKRNAALNAAAIQTAQEIQAMGSKPGRWIAADALRELTSDKVRESWCADGVSCRGVLPNPAMKIDFPATRDNRYDGRRERVKILRWTTYAGRPAELGRRPGRVSPAPRLVRDAWAATNVPSGPRMTNLSRRGKFWKPVRATSISDHAPGAQRPLHLTPEVETIRRDLLPPR
jgi:hypothetical protein